MPIRAIIFILVILMVVAFFCKDEIYAFLKRELREDNNDNENEKENET